MDTLLLILLVIALVLLALLVVAWYAWRRMSRPARELMHRVGRLPWRGKIGLARALVGDERIPTRTRLVLPVLVLYMAMPLDLIPDFVPVLGQLDDVVVAVVGIGLLVRSIPRGLLEE